MTIGSLAKNAEVHVETIRYYQRLGLIQEPPKPSVGYRTYRAEDLEDLRFIRKAKTFGFSLSDIQQLLVLKNEDGSCSDVCALAEKNLTMIRQKIGELETLESQVSRMLSQCQTELECMVLRTLTTVN